ncbi:MAG TPA: hypothetical protein VF362_02115 [Demequinaceae bacterium]
MSIDFRREYQVAWARCEATRLRTAFGSSIVVVEHAHLEMARGDRLLTISDPGGKGASCAVCVTEHSPEGSSWRIELRPILGSDDADVPATRAIQHLRLQMRYNTCVHATWDETVGARSGEDGSPDLAKGVTTLLRGDFKVHRRGSIGGTRSAQYASVLAA